MGSDGLADTDCDVYDVERILAERTIDGVKHYLVKWMGYSDAECTWEPPDNFNNDNTLPDWEALKASGDALEGADLAIVEARMEAFQNANKLQDELVGLESSDDDKPLRDIFNKGRRV